VPTRGFEVRVAPPHDNDYRQVKGWGALPKSDGAPGERLFPRSAEKRAYSPLFEKPVLYREFVDLGDGLKHGDPIPTERIVGFADQFGTLWKPGNEGEPLSNWRHQIRMMQFAVELWEHLFDEDDDWLKGRFEHKRLVPKGTIKGLDTLEWRPKWQPSDTSSIGPVGASLHAQAAAYVQGTTNKMLEGRGFPQLTARGGAEFGLGLRVETLCHGLWLQFALTTVSGRPPWKCKWCGKWSPLTLEDNRAHKQFCSPACKKAEYRDRQHRALDLRQRGKALRDIAKEVDTDLETVKRWLAAVPKGGT
jgi:hypothetical protein